MLTATLDAAHRTENIAKTLDGKDVAKAMDGFANFAAKLGVDPSQCNRNLISQGKYQFSYYTRNRLLLEAAYRGSWLVGKVIDAKADDMTKSGIDLVTNEGAELLPEFRVMMSRLQIWHALRNVIAWGELYGGCIGVLQIKGQNPATPLDLETVGKGQFQGIAVYDRWQVQPSLGDVIESGPEIGLPKFYDISLGMTPGNDKPTKTVRVHHSRCIRAIGIELPFFQAITENMWGESRIERLWDVLLSFDTSTQSAAGLIFRAQLRTVQIDQLRNILAAGGQGEENLLKMFEYMSNVQSNQSITLLDKEDVFSTQTYTFAGLAEMLTQFGQQISGATGIPLVRLFGQSPAGLNATGESDLRQYYDEINAQQETKLRNPLETVLKVMWRSMTGKASPADLSFTFTPLWQLSALDKANVAKTNTDAVLAAQDSGTITRATALQELKQQSHKSGLFTHITDEEIEEAKEVDPPTPDLPNPSPEKLDRKDAEKTGRTEQSKDQAMSPFEKIIAWLKRN